MPTLELTAGGRTAPAGATAPGRKEDAPAEVHTGGTLADRTAWQRADGTWVNGGYEDRGDVGVASLMVKQCLPLFFLQERVHAERQGKSDAYISESKMRLDKDCRLFSMDLGFTPHAYSQLASLAEMPTRYFQKLRARGRYGIASACINAGIVDRRYMDRYDPEGKFLLRMRNGRIRAVQTDSYGIYDNHHFVDTLISALPEGMAVEVVCNHIWGNGDDLVFSFLVPNKWNQEPDDTWGIGAQCGNSEIGKSSLFKRLYLYSGKADAGLSYDRGIGVGTVNEQHRGDTKAVRARVEKAIKHNLDTVLSSSQLLLVQLKRAQGIAISELYVDGVVAFLCRRAGLSQAQGQDWWAHVSAATDGVTAYGLCMALAVSAREKGTAARSELELAAGNMLVEDLKASPEKLEKYWFGVSAAGHRLKERMPDVVAEYTTGPVVETVRVTA